MIRALAVVLTMLFLVSPASADTLSSLIDRYVAWRGGAAYERMTSIHIEADLQAAGFVGSTSEWRERAGRARDDADLGGRKSVEVATDTPWEMIDGLVADSSAAAVTDAQRMMAIEFGDALRGRGAATVRLLAPETREGKTWSVVRVTFEGPDTYDLFLASDTGELHGYRLVRDARTRFVTLRDWRVVNGVRMPFVREEVVGEGLSKVIVKARTVTLNEDFPPSLFARPTGRRLAVFEGGRGTTGPLAFNFYNGNRIYIPAVVNGLPTEVLLDSGADNTVLDKGYAEKLGLKLEGRMTGSGTGGTVDAWIAKGVTIQIGGMRLENLTVGVIDLADVSKRLGIALPVVLGAEVFNHLIVDMDFQDAKIAFTEPDRFTPPAGAVEVPILETQSIRTIPISIEGAEPIQADFDLGSGSPLSLFPRYWQPMGLLEGRKTATVMSGAVGGERPTLRATLKSVTFAGVTFRDVPTYFETPTTKGYSAADSDRSLGIVGLPIFSRFRVIADYRQDRLYMVPHKDAATQPFRKDRAGMNLVVEDNRLRVTSVSPEGPAAAAGWKAGDVIVAIDGRPVTASYSGSELSRWTNWRNGQRVELTLADGSRRTLMLTD